MPKVQVVFYQEEDGSVPVAEWLDRQPIKVQDKYIVRIERLAELGYELHRPESDYLRDGIHELRVRFQSVNYRILYFFHSATNTAAILANGLTKEARVPPKEIEVAVERKIRFEADPIAHTPKEGTNGEDP